MANQSQPISQDVQQYLAAQASGEPAPGPIATPVSMKGKRQKKGVAAPHFASLPKDAPANSGPPSQDIDGLLTHLTATEARRSNRQVSEILPSKEQVQQFLADEQGNSECTDDSEAQRTPA